MTIVDSYVSSKFTLNYFLIFALQHRQKKLVSKTYQSKILLLFSRQYGHTRQNYSELNTDTQNKDLKHKRITDNFIVFNGTLN